MKNNRFYRTLSVLLVIATFFALVLSGCTYANDIPDSGNTQVKNIIVMIPDGAGFGSFDLAEAVKKSGKGLKGLTTPITTDTISGKEVTGLYLSDYLVGTSKTYSANASVTDSAAGGTAIATGYKTNNGAIAITPDSKGAPISSLLEASQIAGKATGLVATKFWFDATPASFASHATSRSNYAQITSQMLNHNLNVLLGGGNGSSYDGKINPANIGYTVVKNKTELEKAVSDGKTKVWSSFNSGSTSVLVMDYNNASRPAHPTLLDMTKAAIGILSENVNDPDGFFLMIEGSQVDSGGHSSNAVQVTSEYLAFDEAFAYAVEWAKKDGNTLVVGVPDHDTGGFTPDDEAEAVDAVSKGNNPDNATWDGNGNHTGQNVPIWAYGPDGVVEELLTKMGLPLEGGKDKARTGKYYRGVEFADEYAVENTALAHGVAAVSGLDLDEATKELFVDITDMGKREGGSFNVRSSGITIPENANYYYLNDGTRVDFKYGVSVYTGGSFYVPKHVAENLKWDNPFPDISEDDSFYEAVAFAHTNKLFNGTEKGFEPMLPMTRAMYVTVLGRLDKADVSGFAVPTFPDVEKGMWYTEYVGWANTNKIVQGDNLGNFLPENDITREEMMIVIHNYAKHLNKPTVKTVSLEYADADNISDWARDAVVYCTAYGLVNADEDGKIRPTEPATRADVALLMMNFVTKVFNNPDDGIEKVVYKFDLNHDRWSPHNMEGLIFDTTLKGNSTSGDPMMTYKGTLDFDISNVTAIKVNVKIPKGQKFEVFFSTDADTVIDQPKSYKFYSTSDDFAEYTIYTDTNSAWDGALYKFRVDPVNTTDTGFEIKSIELIGTGKVINN